MGLSRRTTILNATAAGADQALVAAGTGIFADKSIVVLGPTLFANGAGSAFLESGTTTAITPTFGPSAASGKLVDWPDVNEWGYCSTVQGAALTITTGGAGTVAVHLIWAYR